MALTARVHDLLRLAEAIDRFGDETARPGCARLLNLGDAVAAGALGFFQDAQIGRGEFFIGEQRAGRRHRVVRQIDRRRGRPICAKEFGDGCDRSVGTLDQRVTVVRIADGRGQHLAQRQRAVIAQQQHPGLERAGHAGCQKPGAGHEIETLATIIRDGGAGRRRALPTNDFGLAAARVVDDHRHVAAGTVEMRLDHLQDERGSDRGIERVAALFQRRHADGGRDPMGRCDDAEGAFDLRARRERVRIDHAHAAV